jgi:hypothetical protein
MSADSDMVERVARAIYAVRCCDGSPPDGDGWTDLSSHTQDLWRIYTRAALDASGIGEMKAQNAALCEARDALIAELSRERQVRMELQTRLLDGDRP